MTPSTPTQPAQPVIPEKLKEDLCQVLRAYRFKDRYTLEDAVRDLSAHVAPDPKRVAELEKDKARMDLLERTGSDLHQNTFGGWWLYGPSVQIQDKPTARSALDELAAALSRTKEEK